MVKQLSNAVLCAGSVLLVLLVAKGHLLLLIVSLLYHITSHICDREVKREFPYYACAFKIGAPISVGKSLA